MSDVVFLDLETTGLDPGRHKIWEIGLIAEDVPMHWFLNPDFIDLENADPTALRITRFYERYGGWGAANGAKSDRTPDRAIAKDVAEATAGKHIVGAVPSFDADFLSRWLRHHGFAPAWHYHLVDVEALAAGKLGLKPPWDTDDLADRLGIDSDSFRKHEALEDAKWAKAMYDAVLG